MIDFAQVKTLAAQSGATPCDTGVTFSDPELLAFARACFAAGQEDMDKQRNKEKRMERRDVFVPEDYAKAINVMAEEGRVSPSLVQRKLQIPWMRAKEYVDLAIKEGYFKEPDWMKEAKRCK